MKNAYEVVDSANVITNGKFSVRWAGSKLAPEFVAHDIARAIGHKNTTVMLKKFEHEYVDAKKGNNGRTLMRSMSMSQIETMLSIDSKRLNRDAFREFWEDYVLPEFDSRWAKIASQKKEIARLKADNATLTAENATLSADLGKANEKIISIKSLVA